jgi:hypothetical protein
MRSKCLLIISVSYHQIEMLLFFLWENVTLDLERESGTKEPHFRYRNSQVVLSNVERRGSAHILRHACSIIRLQLC